MNGIIKFLLIIFLLMVTAPVWIPLLGGVAVVAVVEANKH